MDKNCPYVEVILDNTNGVLVVIGASIKETYHMIPTLDKNGDRIQVKVKGAKIGESVQERRMIQTYQEYILFNPSEITDFIKVYAFNADSFDYKKYLNVLAVPSPDTVGPKVVNLQGEEVK